MEQTSTKTKAIVSPPLLAHNDLHVHSFRSDSLQPKVPWDDWDLDPKFFAALSNWTLDNPDSSLDHIMGVICNRIDDGTNILELIPSSPFPARGLVGALMHLVKLGAVRGPDGFPSFVFSMAEHL
jgi:hypothetical protein